MAVMGATGVAVVGVVTVVALGAYQIYNMLAYVSASESYGDAQSKFLEYKAKFNDIGTRLIGSS